MGKNNAERFERSYHVDSERASDEYVRTTLTIVLLSATWLRHPKVRPVYHYRAVLDITITPNDSGNPPERLRIERNMKSVEDIGMWLESMDNHVLAAFSENALLARNTLTRAFIQLSDQIAELPKEVEGWLKEKHDYYLEKREAVAVA